MSTAQRVSRGFHRLALFLAAIPLLVGGAIAEGYCPGERNCQLTPKTVLATKVWKACVFDSMAVQIRHTHDLNAAAEAAFAACKAEEDTLFTFWQTQTHLSTAEAAKLMSLVKPKLKANMLDLFTKGRSSQQPNQ